MRGACAVCQRAAPRLRNLESGQGVCGDCYRDMTGDCFCDNCGAIIGALETAHIHNGHTLCSHCSGRIQPLAGVYTGRKVQPIEKTGKVWKGFMLLGAVMAILGIAMMLLAPVVDPADSTAGVVAGVLGCPMIGFGLVVYLLARVGAWWFHG